MLTDTQKAALAAPLNATNVKQRKQSGRDLSYIESWWAISEANRIFGFDGWTRETISFQAVSEKPRKIGRDNYQKDGWGVTYIAKVRVTVGGVVREGCGAGHGIDADLGLAHESALKEAESDAAKRALMTFGNPFGLALYDKEQTNVEHTPEPTQEQPKAQPKDRNQPFDDEDGQLANTVAIYKNQLSNCETMEDVQDWVEIRKPDLDRIRKRSLPAFNELRNFKEARIQEIIKENKAA